MVRQGVFAFLVCGLFACTTDVDDPANFTSTNSQGNGSSSGTGGTGNETDGNTSNVADNGNSATGTGNVDGTTSSEPATTSDGGNGNCGNGVIDAGEQCDGTDLQGFDCASLGLNGGTLACDPMMCTFDTSMCTSNPGTSG